VGVMTQSRPALPQYMIIDQGSFICLYSSGGPPCVGEAVGEIVAYWRFDDNGDFTNYREDAVFFNNTLIYNREYATPKGTSEYFLAGSTAAELQCVSFSVATSINRNFLSTATYNGQKTVDSEPVYEFLATWIFQGAPTNITAWVSVNTNLLWGWGYGPIQYIYHHYMESPTPFDVSLFTPPASVTCTEVSTIR